MLSGVRQKATYANVMSTIAVFVALGGTSYAALTITGKHVKDSSLTGKDVKNNSLTSSDVMNLTARDFRPGQLPVGATGPAGPAGVAGAKGDPGAKGDKGDPAPAGVLDSSFVYQTTAVALGGDTPVGPQVTLRGSTDPQVSDGPITITQPGILYATASTVLSRQPGSAGGVVQCGIRMASKAISSGGASTFSDAGLDQEGNPAHPTVTQTIVGTSRVEPGEYNVGLLCTSDRPGFSMDQTELHVMVFAR